MPQENIKSQDMPTDKIDQYLPRFDFSEYHEIVIKGLPDDVFGTLFSLDFARSRVVSGLFQLRGLPAKAITLDGLAKSGFIPLYSKGQEELGLGLIARPWRVNGSIIRTDSEGFLNFDDIGYVKVVWNFKLEEHGGNTVLLSTETRIACLNAASRRKFSLYWFVIKPFSGLIRKKMLRMIKEKVENQSQQMGEAL